MKTKLTLFFVSVSILAMVFIYLKVNGDNKLKIPSRAGMKIIKCTTTKFLLDDIDSTKQVAPLFANLGNHEFKIQTRVPEAQVFFNQGLNLAFAFNHAESHRSFLEASRLDPASAMCYWGQAYVLGPNINDQLPDAERKQKAYEAIQKSMKLSKASSDKEKALIQALSARYSADTLADIKQLNMNYMKAMEKVAKTYENDADVLTLYADAIMNTVPWDYWDENGNPSPNIKEAKMALEKATLLNPNHPGANHYYIHMVELPKPDLAVPNAEKLASLMPGAGHMVHMPGHIYMRVGRYREAVEANLAAILVDEDYISQCYSQGQYPLGYYPHNIHFLWSAASMMGNEELSIEAAKKTAEKVSVSNLKEARFFQNFAATPLLAYLRFGKWNEILTTPDPGDDYTYLSMIWHYTRGIAFVRKDNLREAEEELQELASRDKELEFENIAKVAYEVLAGEIAALQGNLPASVDHLKLAVRYEDELPYDEPAVWYIPTRQSLGAVLLKAQKYEEAEKVYLQDLEYYRQNGWSLMGLYQSLLKQEKFEEAQKVKDQFDIAWENADIEITHSIL
jgi:tetratricopeptide (TPR) repeat protein